MRVNKLRDPRSIAISIWAALCTILVVFHIYLCQVHELMSVDAHMHQLLDNSFCTPGRV